MWIFFTQLVETFGRLFYPNIWSHWKRVCAFEDERERGWVGKWEKEESFQETCPCLSSETMAVISEKKVFKYFPAGGAAVFLANLEACERREWWLQNFKDWILNIAGRRKLDNINFASQLESLELLFLSQTNFFKYFKNTSFFKKWPISASFSVYFHLFNMSHLKFKFKLIKA